MKIKNRYFLQFLFLIVAFSSYSQSDPNNLVFNGNKESIKKNYTKAEVDAMVAEAVEEARRIDEASMAKHNREATIISMILGFTALALFVDGLLRILGIIPPFMHLDVNIIERVADRVEVDVMHKIRQVPLERIFRR